MCVRVCMRVSCTLFFPPSFFLPTVNLSLSFRYSTLTLTITHKHTHTHTHTPLNSTRNISVVLEGGTHVLFCRDFRHEHFVSLVGVII